MLTIQNFTSQILEILGQSIFGLVASFRMINYLSKECSGRLRKHPSALEWPPRSPGITIRQLSATNQSSDILQHSQNRPTGDRWLKSKRVQKCASRCNTKRICWYGQPMQMMPKCRQYVYRCYALQKLGRLTTQK